MTKMRYILRQHFVLKRWDEIHFETTTMSAWAVWLCLLVYKHLTIMIDDKDIKDEDDHWSPGCGFPRAVSQQNWSRQQPSSPSPTPFTIRILILILKTKLAFNIFVENVKPPHLPIMILTKLILLSLIKVWNLSNQSVELAAGLSPVLEHPLGGHLSHRTLLSLDLSSNLSSFWARWSSAMLRNWSNSFIFKLVFFWKLVEHNAKEL